MAFRTTLIILGLVSLCTAQSADDAAAEVEVEADTIEEEVPAPKVVEEPKVAKRATPRAERAAARAAPVPEPAVERKMAAATPAHLFQTVTGAKTKYAILEEGNKKFDFIEVGDTPHAAIQAYVMGSDTPFFDTANPELGGHNSVNWFAGESEDLAGPDDQPPAKDFSIDRTKHIVGRMPKGIDKGMMGAYSNEKRELHIPSDEFFMTPSASIPKASEYRVVVWISKVKHKVMQTKSTRRLQAKQAEEEKERIRLGLPKEQPAAAAMDATAKAAPKARSTYAARAAVKEEQDLKKAEEM